MVDVCDEVTVHEMTVKKVKSKMAGPEEMYTLAELFKVFGDNTRIAILEALSESEMCVCDISACIDKSIYAVSHQLRVLRHNKLVKSIRKGKELLYSLADDHIEKILKIAKEHINE